MVKYVFQGPKGEAKSGMFVAIGVEVEIGLYKYGRGMICTGLLDTRSSCP